MVGSLLTTVPRSRTAGVLVDYADRDASARRRTARDPGRVRQRQPLSRRHAAGACACDPRGARRDRAARRSRDAFSTRPRCSSFARGDLRLISVWHPSFLDRLLDTISEQIPRLVTDIENGTLSPPGCSSSANACALLHRSLRADRKRGAFLRRCAPDDIRAIWPDLALVSCWADGPSRAPAQYLAERLGGVALQRKGLLATEGVSRFRSRDSIPWRSDRTSSSSSMRRDV